VPAVPTFAEDWRFGEPDIIIDVQPAPLVNFRAAKTV
jgi:hypothetical protein